MKDLTFIREKEELKPGEPTRRVFAHLFGPKLSNRTAAKYYYQLQNLSPSRRDEIVIQAWNEVKSSSAKRVFSESRFKDAFLVRIKIVILKTAQATEIIETKATKIGSRMASSEEALAAYAKEADKLEATRKYLAEN